MIEADVVATASIEDTDLYFLDREKFIIGALEDGFTIILPEADELLLDIDCDRQYEHFLKSAARLQAEFGSGWVKWKQWPSKSGLPHRHVLVKLGMPVTSHERIALEAGMGSDRTRTLLSVLRLKYEDPNPSILAVPPGVDVWSIQWQYK